MIDLMFHILNLLLRIGVVIFVVRKYLLHRIVQSMKNEKESIGLLDNQYVQIKDSCSEIEQNLKEQEQLYHGLQAKFAAWQTAVQREQQRHEQQCLAQDKKLQLKIEKKQQYVQRRYVIEQQLPAILMDTQVTLFEQFKKDPSLHTSYITKVLRALHE